MKNMAQESLTTLNEDNDAMIKYLWSNLNKYW